MGVSHSVWYNESWNIFSKTELEFCWETSFRQFPTGFFQVWGKCLPQSFPTPNGVTVLDCPAILLGHVCFDLTGRCYCQYLFTKIWQMLLPIFVYQNLADVIAIICLPKFGRCYCHLFCGWCETTCFVL